MQLINCIYKIYCSGRVVEALPDPFSGMGLLRNYKRIPITWATHHGPDKKSKIESAEPKADFRRGSERGHSRRRRLRSFRRRIIVHMPWLLCPPCRSPTKPILVYCAPPLSQPFSSVLFPTPLILPPPAGSDYSIPPHLPL